MANIRVREQHYSGRHGHDFPPLDPEVARTIAARFNEDQRFFPALLGLRVVELKTGYARLEVENRMQLMQPAGVMHGGASFGLADTAVAAALATLYEAGTVLLTIEMKINYLEPIPAGLVTAEAFVLRASKRSAYAEVDVWAGGQLAARATTTYMIRPPELRA
ncbi:MAG: PaaI family thioesterase [candidate division KSB1 bacterium]|nr:PaaI family thioesterase [candidate division KSB1 bacterium]